MSDKSPFEAIKLEPYLQSHKMVEPPPPAFSEEALALEFADRHNVYTRYVAAWSRWMVWDGTVWRADKTLGIYDQCRRLCREFAAHCDEEGTGRRLATSKTVAGVVSLIRADRRIAATIDQWDCGDWLLNTPGGVVDLTSGKLRIASPGDYLTKITRTAPGGDCPRWCAFLARVTNGDAELQAYLQRVAGYCLTGLTREHALFFLFGHGANGKSVFVDTLMSVVGDYGKGAPIETFVASSSDRHPTEIAGLRGARLVTAVETEEGRRWAESKIKALTGGDRIAARFMRQDFFEYQPQFKLIIAGNHKPGLRSVDEAIRRRFNLIPFTVTIPAEERDETLTEKLRAEASGILAWAIAGCLEWQRIGLSPPKAVTEATARYLEAEDAVAEWIDEHCQLDPQAFESSAALFASWKSWAERSGETVGSKKSFVQALETQGFTRAKFQGNRGLQGLRLSRPEPQGRYGDFD
ncbi:UNVERIFIED_ORG: putative DNA primase/helicase [Rhizobium etli]